MRLLILSITILFTAVSGFAKDYFQQDVEYKIEVRLDDIKHELHGFETVKYKNNSPEALPFIYFHIWPNAYKETTTALGKQLTESGNLSFHFSDKKDRGYIDSLNFMVNGEVVKMEPDPEHIDICKLILNKPLQPGETITITTPFHVKIPSAKFSRLGHIDQSYQISQWYPKPAVYDRNGWNQMPYLNQGEFYSEYGTFDVYITLPKNYVVGSTGDLVNGESELAWLDEKVKVTETIKEFNPKDLKFPPSDPEMKTLHYHQEKVHDFAWFADKRYHVLKGEVTLPHSKRKVTTWTMFTNAEGKLWSKSIEYMNDAIYNYSLWNGDYPYNHATAVDGTLSAGAGMEYPNVTVIGTSGNAFQLEIVIVHEVGHNWFYGILGSNERIHPWMDEGLNSFNELRYVKTKYPDRKLVGETAESGIAKTFDFAHLKQKAQYELSYLINAKRNLDQPIELPAHEYTELNYGGIVYSKTALVFDYLRAYLGTSVFDKAMQSYYEEWKFKHPQPEDLRHSLESSTGKNLSWFFDDMIKTTKKLDYKICRAHVGDKGYPEIKIKNKGDIAGPVNICAIKDGKMRASIWHEMPDSLGKTAVLGIPPGDYDKIVIDFPGEMPEISKKNNTYKLNGLFKKTEPLRIQFIGAVENPNKTQLYFAPIGGWNKYDGGMAGIALYNHFFPERKFQYTLAPMYGFKSETLTGFASISQTFYPDRVFQNIRIGVGGRRFSLPGDQLVTSNGNYLKIKPELSFELKNKRGRSSIKQTITAREVIVQERYKLIPDVTPFAAFDKDVNIAQIAYTFANNRKLNPYGFGITVENNHTSGSEYTKLMAEAEYYISYKGKKNKGLDIRIFGGHMFDEPADLRYMFGFGYPASGLFDYTYDHLHLGRFETTGFLSQQVVEKDAGFIHPTNTSFRNKSIGALNLKAAVPFKLPVYIYANTGASNNVKDIVFESGASFAIVKDFCEVYFPIYQTHPVNSLSYGEKIRFTLNLHLANPFDFARNFSM